MIILNFSHPLTTAQAAQIEDIVGQSIQQVVELPVQFDHLQPFTPQLEALMAHLPPEVAQTLQTAPILVILPSLSIIAALVLAELHGRMGYFPPVIRLRSVADSMPPRYEVAEIINLQKVRDRARSNRPAMIDVGHGDTGETCASWSR